MIVDGVLEPMEIAHLPYKKGRTYEDYLGLRGIERLGKRKWRRHVTQAVTTLKNALGADYVVVGGGNAKLLKKLPAGARLGDNATAFVGGFRLWEQRDDVGRSRPPRSFQNVPVLVPKNTAIHEQRRAGVRAPAITAQEAELGLAPKR